MKARTSVFGLAVLSSAVAARGLPSTATTPAAPPQRAGAHRWRSTRAHQRAGHGRADESMFTDTDPVLHRNKQATLHIMRELLQCGQWDRSGEWLTDRYIQHNPNANSGREGVVFFFTQVMRVAAHRAVRPADDGDRRRDGRGRPRHRDLAAQLRGPAPSRPVLLDDVVRHLALRRRQSRRALGSGDRGAAALADAVPARPVSVSLSRCRAAALSGPARDSPIQRRSASTAHCDAAAA